MWKYLVFVLVVAGAVDGAAKKSLTKELRCAVCETVVDEVAWSLYHTKSMDVDLRWRLGPDGKRDGKTIPYRQSEVAAVEVLESVCKTMDDYAQGEKDGVKTLERFNSRPGQTSITINNIQMDSNLSKKFKEECERIVEEGEETLTKSITKGDSWDEMHAKLCSKKCSNLKRPKKVWAVDTLAANNNNSNNEQKESEAPKQEL